MQKRLFAGKGGRVVPRPIRLNWYVYCGNDPVNYVDWLGLEQLNVKDPNPNKTKVDGYIKKIESTQFGQSEEGQKVTKALQDMNDNGKIEIVPKEKMSRRDGRDAEYFPVDEKILINRDSIDNKSDNFITSVVAHEGTHRVQHIESGMSGDDFIKKVIYNRYFNARVETDALYSQYEVIGELDDPDKYVFPDKEIEALLKEGYMKVELLNRGISFDKIEKGKFNKALNTNKLCEINY